MYISVIADVTSFFIYFWDNYDTGVFISQALSLKSLQNSIQLDFRKREKNEKREKEREGGKEERKKKE